MKHLSKCALHIVHVHICFINVFTLRGRAQTKVLTVVTYRSEMGKALSTENCYFMSMTF